MIRLSRVKTAAASDPVTVAEVKLNARVAHSVEDALIEQWIKAATKMAGEYQHRSYVKEVYRLIFDKYPPSCFDLPMSPLISVDSVKYYDTDDNEATFADTNYFIDTISEVGRFSLNDNAVWPTTTLRPINSVIVEFTSGYGDDATAVPDSVKNAIYLYCTFMYENRDAEAGTIPKAFFDILKPDRMVSM